jgi:hypothetical protein
VDSRNTIFKLAQIRISSTKALKFDRTSGSKQHNINFHVFFDYTAGKTCFYLHALLGGARMKHRQKDYRPWIPEILKFDRTSGSKQHNINFHVFFDYTAGKTCFLSPRTG